MPTPPSIVRNDVAAIRQLFDRNVIPSYSRFDLALSHGSGSVVWDVTGKRFLDFGAGIAVNCLGHAHPELTQALVEQSRKLVHVSNLYYHEPQGRLALAINNQIAPGKCFFCNSGAEANEGLFKLARKFGHDQGRFEIITAFNSFHGRTLAGIAATGQEKIKKGFEPAVPGFHHVPFNDLAALENALTPSTAAVLIECIQGESGIAPVSPEYLLSLRKLCDAHNLLLLVDEVQAGHFRTGRFHSYQRLLEDVPNGFLPDAVSMAKAIGGGFPMGAFWVRQPYADLLGPGSHASTFGGTPLACAVALKVFEIIERDQLARHARDLGEMMKQKLQSFAQRWPALITAVRGCGLMIGIELASSFPSLPKEERPSVFLVKQLHAAGLLTIPAGNQVVRLLPALNLNPSEADEGLRMIEGVFQSIRSAA